MAELENTEPNPEDLLHVALCREADDLRAMHKLIGVKAGEEPWVYWECQGSRRTPSAVESLLGACGFTGSGPQRPEVITLGETEVNCIALVGFTLPRQTYAQVRTAIALAIAGQVGGFVPLIVAQAGFHDTAIDVLSYVWTQTDRPPIWVRTPELSSRGSGTSVPESISRLAHGAMSIQSSAYLRSFKR